MPRRRPKGIVSATSDDASMAITMKSFGLTWTDPDGTPRAAAVSYGESAGQDRRQQLVAGGCTDVELTEIEIGKLPLPKAA